MNTILFYMHNIYVYVYFKLFKKNMDGYICYLISHIKENRPYLNDDRVLYDNVHVGAPENNGWYFVIYKDYTCTMIFFNKDVITKDDLFMAYIEYNTIISK